MRKKPVLKVGLFINTQFPEGFTLRIADLGSLTVGRPGRRRSP